VQERYKLSYKDTYRKESKGGIVGLPQDGVEKEEAGRKEEKECPYLFIHRSAKMVTLASAYH